MTSHGLTQNTAEDATPLHIVSDLDAFMTDQSPEAVAWVRSQQYRAEAGQYLSVPGFGTNAGFVLVGASSQPSLATLGALPTALPEGRYQPTSQVDELDALGWALGAYQFTRYKQAKRSPAQLVIEDHVLYNSLVRTAAATALTRDLINAPANDMLPSHLEEASRTLAEQFDANIKVTTGEALLRAGYNTIHAVGRASADEPRLIDLTWGDEKHPLITLVGKGVCFDSGGLNIKPAGGMRTMKKDMGGAAQVLGLAQLIMATGLHIRLRVLVSAVENAISANAYRPGDIIRTYKGLTVEIDNTDAEGRLVLCDALALACEDDPELVVDYATLTGSARSAVGAEIAAMFCNRDDVAEAVYAQGVESDDAVWRLPLHAPYKKMLKAAHADSVNSAASPYAGAITAALFLEQFISNEVPWLHFDLMAWNLSSRPGHPEGGEAMGVRAVFQYLANRYG